VLLRLFYFREARIGWSVGWSVVQSVGCLPILHIFMPVLSLCLVFPIMFITFILLLQLDSGTLLEIGIGSEQKEISRPILPTPSPVPGVVTLKKGQQLRSFFCFFVRQNLFFGRQPYLWHTEPVVRLLHGFPGIRDRLVRVPVRPIGTQTCRERNIKDQQQQQQQPPPHTPQRFKHTTRYQTLLRGPL